MPNIRLTLMLSSDRNLSGLLLVQESGSGQTLATFEALGRGNRGPGDTQLKVEGNTPTGQYKVTKFEPTGAWDQGKFGPHGALRLVALSGNAKIAADEIGRKGLLIHGGNLGQTSKDFRGIGELRATQGCIRLSNESMKTLVELLFQATHDAAARISQQIEVTLTVTQYNTCFARPH